MGAVSKTIIDNIMDGKALRIFTSFSRLGKMNF
jgi:hypothetical protein